MFFGNACLLLLKKDVVDAIDIVCIPFFFYARCYEFTKVNQKTPANARALVDFSVEAENNQITKEIDELSISLSRQKSNLFSWR